MAETTVPNPNEMWRGFTKRAAIASCKLRKDDFKRLYRIIDEKQIEHRKQVLGQLHKTNEETLEQFQQRYARVENAFITTVMITGVNGEAVSGHGESLFDSASVPERIMSVLYDTSFIPKSQLQYTPTNQASVLLDFSRPSLLNFGTPAVAPTSNNSYWFVSADTESWFTSLCTRLQDFFAERATRTDWLHNSGIYTALLLVFGLPLSIWGDYRLGNILTATIGNTLHPVLSTALYVYLFFLLLNGFQMLFSYSRWVFPKLEWESQPSTASQHRALLYLIVVGVLGAALWDAFKALMKF